MSHNIQVMMRKVYAQGYHKVILYLRGQEDDPMWCVMVGRVGFQRSTPDYGDPIEAIQAAERGEWS